MDDNGTGSAANKDTDVAVSAATGSVVQVCVPHQIRGQRHYGLTEVYSDAPGGPGGPISYLSHSYHKPTLMSNTSAIRLNMGFYRESLR